MTAFKDLSGRRFGRWTVLQFDREKSRPNRHYYMCRCDCGTVRSVRRDQLTCHRSRGCGCAADEALRERLTTHGAHDTSEYWAWVYMKQRCYNPNTRGYHNYGGRGITVCDCWRDNFAAFLADMGPKPSPRHTLDRIDTDGDDTPANCRWATMAEQQVNKRANVRFTHNGCTKTVMEWSRQLGINVKTLQWRLRDGWPVDEALTIPAQSGHGPLTYNNLTMSVVQWSATTGIDAQTLRYRLRHGWSVEKTLTTPVRH